MSISLRIKELIKQKKLSQKELADVLLIDTSQFSKIVNGKLQPTLSQLMEISSFLKVSLDWLCFGKIDVAIQDHNNFKDLAEARLEIIEGLKFKIADLEKQLLESKYTQKETFLYSSVADPAPELIKKTSK